MTTRQVRLYRNGRVLTPEHPAATALLVDGDGAVGWVGTEADAERLVDGATESIDLGGGVVLPGFVDAHVHLSHTGMGLRGVDLGTARSVGEALDLLEAAARRTGGRPIYAPNWQEQDWAEHRPVTDREIDRASFGGVVYASRIDGHSAVISSALAAASGARGLDGWLGDGLVARDAKNAARAAFDAALPEVQRREDIEIALRAAAAQGIVAVHECGGPLLTSAEDFALCLALGHREDLPEVVGYWAEQVSDPEQARDLLARHGARGLAGDLNIDGSIGSRTAHLREPYADAPGHLGTAFRTTEAVLEHVAACALAGIQSGFHVIGDAGMDTVLEGMRQAARAVGIEALRASRPRVEHAEMIDPAGVAELARLGVHVSGQPAFDAFWGGTAGMYAARLGPARVAGMNPFRSYTDAGVALALGSDSPVTPFAPWGAIRAAVDHHDPRQRVDVGVAFRAHTTGGWRAARDDEQGVLRTGVPATFAVWEGIRDGEGDPLVDLLGADGAARCILTVLAGETIHRS